MRNLDLVIYELEPADSPSGLPILRPLAKAWLWEAADDYAAALSKGRDHPVFITDGDLTERYLRGVRTEIYAEIPDHRLVE